MTNIATTFGIGSGNTQTDVALFGVECEIESVNYDATDWGLFSGLEVKEDPSLRNYGQEIVWSGPKPLKHSNELFQKIHANLKFYDKNQKFSERTSTHVHLNCRGLSTEQVVNMVRLYALYEDLIFMCVEPSRRDNIYCVPLADTYLTALYGVNDIVALVSRWQKYTAFNIKPLSNFGSVEFRHLQGTDDPQLMSNWLFMLERLFFLSQSQTISAVSLTETNLQMWADVLFGHFPFYKFVRGDVLNIISNSVIDVKLGFM